MSDEMLIEVRDAHRFDQAVLEAYLSLNLKGFKGPMTVRQFEGGQSNPTYLLTTPSAKYVMRKQPPGNLLPSAHQVDREHRIMNALSGSGVPVPKMHVLCMDNSVIGTSFYVMDFVEGKVFSDASLPGLTPKHRAAAYHHLASVLAKLHSIEPASVGLEDYGRSGNYFSRQISRWTRQYQASATEDIKPMNDLIEWLPNHVPDSEEVRIVHGDYRIGNCIVDETSSDILAVIDWELSTLGDPLADLGYLCQMYYIDAFEFGLGGKDIKSLGIPSMDEFVSIYCNFRGLTKVDHLEFSIIYNLFRLAGISQGVYKRGLEGNASSKQALEFKDVARAYSETAWQLVQTIK